LRPKYHLMQATEQQAAPQNGESTRNRVKETFRAFAHSTAEQTGSVWAFVLALLIVVLWLATGPYFHYSDTWQLVINTGTTIVTFLMVFLIQSTQNRDTREIHLKLDELIRSHKRARDLFMNLECLSDEDLDEISQRLTNKSPTSNPAR
jgi:low affinity Fe/Cu permease